MSTGYEEVGWGDFEVGEENSSSSRLSLGICDGLLGTSPLVMGEGGEGGRGGGGDEGKGGGAGRG